MRNQAEALAILEWYVASGVDETIADKPQNRSELAIAQREAAMQASMPSAAATPPAPAKPAAPLPQMATPRPAAAQPAAYASQSNNSLIADARKAAEACKTIDALREAVENFEGCGLKKLATNTVFADGNAEAPIMFVGEAPGQDEDRQGIPFCGVSGKLLDKMLAAIGLDRETAYISNTLFWRPPGNRQPSTDEIEICRPFVEKHIALASPKLVVMVGSTAAKSMLDVTTGITRLRGKQHAYTNPYLQNPLPAFALFHPAYLLRQPHLKALAWRDLLQIKQVLGSQS